MKTWTTYTATQDLTAGALSYSTPVIARQSKALQVTIAASETITETITLTLDSVKGSAYDLVVITDTLTAERYWFTMDLPYLEAGDALKVQVSNAHTTGAVSVTIAMEIF